jgi:hypothetical protein
MKWPKKYTKNLIYKALMNTEPKTEEQIANAAINIAVKKQFYEFDPELNTIPVITELDSKDQAHIMEVVKEIIKNLTENELLRVYVNGSISLNTDGMSFVLSALPKTFF